MNSKCEAIETLNYDSSAEGQHCHFLSLASALWIWLNYQENYSIVTVLYLNRMRIKSVAPFILFLYPPAFTEDLSFLPRQVVVNEITGHHGKQAPSKFLFKVIFEKKKRIILSYCADWGLEKYSRGTLGIYHLRFHLRYLNITPNIIKLRQFTWW